MMEDIVLEVELNRIKTRHWFQNHTSKMTGRTYGSPKDRHRVLVAPPMPKPISPSKVTNQAPAKPLTGRPIFTEAGDGDAPVQRFKSYSFQTPVEDENWVRERRGFREALNDLGFIRNWLLNKPQLTDWERLILRREEKAAQLSSGMCALLTPSEAAGVGPPGLCLSERRRFGQSQSLLAGSERQDGHSLPPSPVEHLRHLRVGEYLRSLELCQKQGINVSQVALQRVLLHPGDTMMGGHGFMTRNNVRALGEGEEGGKEAGEEEAALRRTHREMPVFSSSRAILRGPKVMTCSTCHTEVRHQCGPTHEEYGYPTRKRRQVWTRRADPNAFWPGREEHVRLYLPQVGFSPGGVLFQCIQHTPAPSPGNWPVSPQGYSTSGDIDGHKVYTL